MKHVEEKPVPMPLYIPQIFIEVAWDLIRACLN
jgi:hypothetical protein